MIAPDGIDAETVVSRRDDLAQVELDGEVVIYDDQTGAMHLLDPIAAIVWNCLDGQVALRQLGDELSEAFGTDVTTVTRDVVAGARRFGEMGLLRGVEASASPTPTAIEQDDEDCL